MESAAQVDDGKRIGASLSAIKKQAVPGRTKKKGGPQGPPFPVQI
jgi:hypothetical protein